MKFAVLTVSLVFLAACSTTQRNLSQPNWPEQLPPLSYFTDYYAQDPEHQEVLSESGYLNWIKRFYLGWELYRRGWLQATDELVATLDDPEDKRIARERAEEIGRLVSPEWAKARNYRVINTRHLTIWGNALNKSMVKQEQLIMLDKILSDVKILLDRKLQPKDIASNRYYEPESFGGNFY